MSDDLAQVSLDTLLTAKNWQAKYRLLIAWGKLVGNKPDIRTDEYLIHGCEMPAWLSCRQEDGRCFFTFDSDSQIMNGLVALLLSCVNGKTPLEIQRANLVGILQEAGLAKHLTSSRTNGFKRIVQALEADH